MSRLIARLSSSAALVLAAGLLTGAGPTSDQPTAEGRSVRTPSAATQVLNADPAPDENRPAAPAAVEPGGQASARTAQSILPTTYYYARLLGTDFQPRTTTTTFAYGGMGCIYQTGGADNRFIGHLDLPQGASLKFLRVYYNDTSATNTDFWLTKYTPGQGSADIVYFTSTGTAGYGSALSAEIGGSLPTDPAADVVDNATYSYTVIVGPTASTSAQQFCGARVAYTFPSDGHFTAIAPCRLVDTRAPAFPAPLGGGWLPPATVRSYTIAGVCGLPAGVKAVSLNATVTAPSGPGFLTLYPQGGAFPPVSTLNFWGGDTIVNSAIVPLSPTGGISMALGVSGGHVILDINGYYY